VLLPGSPRGSRELRAADATADAASVSEHLKVLRETGLVALERRGRFRLYRTEPACMLEVARSIDQLARPHGAD
jgi:DNA-binding transcriptional ArsR family regulator